MSGTKQKQDETFIDSEFWNKYEKAVEENNDEKKKKKAASQNKHITKDNKSELQPSEDSVDDSKKQVKEELTPNNKNNSENDSTETDMTTSENTEDLISHKEKFKEIILRENITTTLLKSAGKEYFKDRYGHELKDNLFFQQY